MEREDAGGDGQGLHEQERGRGIVEAQQGRHEEIVEGHVVGEDGHAHHGVEQGLAVGHEPVRLVEEAQVAAPAGEGPVAARRLPEERGRGGAEQRGHGPARDRRLGRLVRRERPGQGGGEEWHEQEEGRLRGDGHEAATGRGQRRQRRVAPRLRARARQRRDRARGGTRREQDEGHRGGGARGEKSGGGESPQRAGPRAWGGRPQRTTMAVKGTT